MRRLITSCSAALLIALLIAPISVGADEKPLRLKRGPYLQNATATAKKATMTVCWRTSRPVAGYVRYGTKKKAMKKVVKGPVATDHSITLEGLKPGTTYFYQVGEVGGEKLRGETRGHFRTSPPAGTAVPTRIWVIGDFGTGGKGPKAVYERYLEHTGDQHTDVWLHLGDNAYGSGTDKEFDKGLFRTYPKLLRQTCSWSCLGNHDGRSADSATQTGPYYDIYHFPTRGEAGGVPSGTEAYYSFDYGRIHFISLDSYETDRSVGGAMYQWLEADLQATQGKYDWTLVFWHHPPYSAGTHPCDMDGKKFGGEAESTSLEMRDHFIPLLEAYDVDLVFSGHSHVYERSVLLDGLYGVGYETRASYVPSVHAIDAGDGRSDGDGAYVIDHAKPDSTDDGIVYCVTGNSAMRGKWRDPNGPLPYMVTSHLGEGSTILLVDGNTLELQYLNSKGEITDRCRLTHP